MESPSRENRQTEYAHEKNARETSISALNNPPDLKSTLVSMTGNILEWYDFAVFGYFSDIIGEVFFPPNQKGSAALVEAFVVYGLAFLARPIGGAIIGRMGDMSGRKGALECSIFWMAFSTFTIGCLPTYEMVGLFSPILLTIMRIIQGMSLGGQFVSLILFTLEQRDPCTWGFWGAAVNAVAKIGSFIGSALTLIIRECLTDDQVKRWGWRIPFWFGAIGALPAIYLKLRVKEYFVAPYTQASNPHRRNSDTSDTSDTSNDSMDDCENGQRMEREYDDIMNNDDTDIERRDPLKEAFSKKNFTTLIASSLVPALYSGINYLIFVWFVIFMNTILKPPIPHAYEINTINVAFGGIIFTVMGGWFADWYGDHKKLLIISGIMCGITSPMAFLLLGKGGEYTGLVAFSVQLYFSTLLVIFSAAMVPWLVSNTPVKTRLTIISFGLNVCSLMWGGFTPLIATILANRISFIAPSYMLTTAAIMSLVGVYLLHKKNKRRGLNFIDGGNVPLLQ